LFIPIILLHCTKVLEKETVGEFTIVSSKNVPIKYKDPVEVKARVGVTTKKFCLFSFTQKDLTSGDTKDYIREAIDKALEQAGPDYNLLINTRIYYIKTSSPFEEFKGYEVKGTAVKIENNE